MKKTFLTLFGALLLGLETPSALALTMKDFANQVFRPDNIAAGPGNNTSATGLVNAVLQYGINFILYASGGIAVALFVYAGFTYVISMGNDEKAGEAKKIMRYAATGLLAVILAYAIVTNVIDIIYRTTT